MRYGLVVLGVLAIAAILGGIKFAQISKLIGFGGQMQAAGPPPEAVGTAKANATSWETTIAAVGSVAGAQSVAVSNDSPGLVAKISFESGKRVKKGDILIELDARQEQAQLTEAKANSKNASEIASRSRELVDKGAIPREQADTEETASLAAAAKVGTIEAQIEQKVVRAPFAGRLGIRAVDLGQYLAPGTKVTTLDSDEGTYVDFTLAQEQLPNIKVGMAVRIVARGVAKAVDGVVAAIDPTLDESTRNFRLRARATGDVSSLRPGMFVDVEVVLPTKSNVVIVPATAVVHAAYGDSVFVIQDKPPGSPGMTTTPDGHQVQIARQQFVKLGSPRGDFVAITKGVEAGQRVVSAGAFKLRNGAPVYVDDRVQPAPSLAPHPENR